MSIQTWDLLKSIGFVEDQSVISDPPGGLSLDFGNFKLEASFVINQYFREVVMLDGVMSDSRSIALVESEMPRQVESWEQGVAWITWCLDNHATGGLFEPVLPMKWLTEGRLNRHLLPWERERAAYAARPHCQVQRDWAKVALRKLSELVETLDDDVPIIFQFNGEILMIRCSITLIAIPASGKAWPSQYSLKAKQLRRLPKRLMHEVVDFSFWDSALTIGRFRYNGVVALDYEVNGDKP